ncbi:MAG: cytochrome b/b6 domain-containing protein [Paracoccaceae bacterium]
MTETKGYSKAQILLHWAIVLLLIVSYVSSDGMKDAWRAFNKGSEDYANIGAAIHVRIGIAVLVLALLRLMLRFGRGAPAAPDGGHPVAELVAKITHLGLYLLIVLIPAAGLAAWFGGIGDAGEVHEALFNVLVVLVALHVAAALFHQFVLKDGLMERMRRPG